MKESKFRVWNDKQKRWETDYDDIYIDQDGEAWCFTECGYDHYMRGMNHLEISFYTGLEDKNSKEIYEKDIVKDVNGTIYIVEWSPPYFALYRPGPTKGSFLETMFYDFYGIVIGNFYENPELLKD